VLAACGGGGGAGSKLSLVDKGTLTVCSDPHLEPFEFPKGDGYQGFDIDLVNAVAAGLDLKVKIVPQPFQAIWTRPQTGACDLAVSAISITDQRKSAALFSQPYFTTDQSLLVRKADESAYSSLDELDERTVGVEAGSTGEAYAQANAPKGATIKPFTDASQLLAALQSKDVDAVLQDQSVSNYLAGKHGDSLAVATTFATHESYAMAAATGAQQLVDAVNGQLDKLKSNKKYDQIYESWFGRG
jgi:polar amino acid transport system substrate-binding protein